MDVWERIGCREVDSDCAEYGEVMEDISRTRRILGRYNSPGLSDREREGVLEELLGYRPRNCSITPPFHCDVGRHIRLGESVRANYDCIFLDCGVIEIGDNTMIGPRVTIIGADHPKDHARRRKAATTNVGVRIGSDVWLGAGALILPGVTVGDRAIVGAGSVVTRDVAPDDVVAGNPARSIKRGTSSGEGPGILG
ncbi:MAG: sugar O-acetyltransferase [Candidatus Methanomethylophilaceae archaeon]|jgi:maltose O-acetyltransferase|nr:sugar O-acetyltransferase [Candidatus Methanomethylophilaceae archaeon]NLF33533.1 sugar O-acetyltransferase [Thermoplasmatales archaeon]